MSIRIICFLALAMLVAISSGAPQSGTYSTGSDGSFSYSYGENHSNSHSGGETGGGTYNVPNGQYQGGYKRNGY